MTALVTQQPSNAVAGKAEVVFRVMGQQGEGDAEQGILRVPEGVLFVKMS